MKTPYSKEIPESKIVAWKGGKNGELIFEQNSHILIMLLKGNLDLKIQDVKAGTIEWGQLLLLPSGNKYTLRSHISTEIIFFQLPDCIALMEKFLPQEIFTIKKKVEPLKTLPINTLLWEYSRNAGILLHECNLTPIHKKIKQVEFFCLMAESYSHEELSGFFHPLIRYDSGFCEFVWENYTKVKTVRELAYMAHQSISSFEKRFKIVFGLSPYCWIIERKKEKLIHELTHSSDQIQELTEKCGFSSASQMVEFCKKYTGYTPSQLRRRSRL